jgi:hypothetical protein
MLGGDRRCRTLRDGMLEAGSNDESGKNRECAPQCVERHRDESASENGGATSRIQERFVEDVCESVDREYKLKEDLDCDRQAKEYERGKRVLKHARSYECKNDQVEKMEKMQEGCN